MAKNQEPVVITVLKAAAIASIVFHLVYTCTLTGVMWPRVDENIVDLYEHSKLRHDEADPFYIVNVVRYMMVFMAAILITIEIAQIVAVSIEDTCLMTALSIILLIIAIVKIVFIAMGRFVALSLSLSYLLIEVIVIATNLALASRMCANRCVMTNYVSGMFESI